jgi:hypothetical protein
MSNPESKQLAEVIALAAVPDPDPADVANMLLKTGGRLTGALERQVSAITKTVSNSATSQEGYEMAGAGQTVAVDLLRPIHEELKKLQALVGQALNEVAKAGL